ncbi:MAG: hypothetical protein JW874_14935 [Spirochaetales bacterium]|nr:hypothetical protein [Spirochaetales bacterium]
MSVVKEYDIKLDNKHRVTIRDAEYEYYSVKQYSDGHIELQPRVLVDPKEISVKTLKMMDRSVENLKKGKVSKPIDLASIAEG